MGLALLAFFLLSVYGWRQSIIEEMSVTKYQPKDSFESPRFCGIPTFMRLPCKQTLTDVDFIVAGIPFDTGSSFRVGTRFGPQATRAKNCMDFSNLEAIAVSRGFISGRVNAWTVQIRKVLNGL